MAGFDRGLSWKVGDVKWKKHEGKDTPEKKRIGLPRKVVCSLAT